VAASEAQQINVTFNSETKISPTNRPAKVFYHLPAGLVTFCWRDNAGVEVQNISKHDQFQKIWI
jgi:hypothetical protein